MSLDLIPATSEWLHKPLKAPQEPQWEPISSTSYEWTNEEYIPLFIRDDVTDHTVESVFTISSTDIVHKPVETDLHRDVYVLSASDATLEMQEPAYALHTTTMSNHYEKYKKYTKNRKRALKRALKDNDLHTVKDILGKEGFILFCDEIMKPTGEVETVNHPLSAGRSFSVSLEKEMRFTGEARLLIVDRKPTGK